MTASLPPIQLGPYSVGEIPEPLQVTFKTHDGSALDLTGYSADFVIEKVGTGAATDSALGTGAATIPTPASGVTQYAWDAADFEYAGRYEAQMWVGNASTRRLASRKLYWDVVDVTAAPDI